MDENYNKIIGANIRYERKLRNFSIEDLGTMLDIAPSFLGLIERGQRGTSINNLCRIANFFSITLDTLITRDLEFGAPPDEMSFLQQRGIVAGDLIINLSTPELNFVIETIKNLKKLRKIE